jgi:predicted ABC-type transport system involved in lysophospholipase L1 biosynthesis ATPase subunit
LLSILGLLDTPSDGAYVLNEQPVENLSLSERARIRNREVGFIFQSFNLVPVLTAASLPGQRERRAAPRLMPKCNRGQTACAVFLPRRLWRANIFL